MSSDKKDLTRIEDLGEYLHELEAAPEEMPELSAEEDTLELGATLDSPSEQEASFELPDENTAVVPEESTDFGSESNFGSSDFGTSTFEEPQGFGDTSDFAVGETTPGEESNASDFGATNEEDPFPDSASTYDGPFGESTSSKEDLPSFSASLQSASDSDSIASNSAALANAPDEEERPQTFSSPKTPIEFSPELDSAYKAAETFQDVKQFAESSSFTGMGAEGNPSFSVLIKNVRYIEDVSDIMLLMKELTLIVDSEDQMRERLMRGQVLVPRISEFAAVLLAHKLRRFDVDIQVGLSDEIHPPKHKEAPETGLVSKHGLYQNQAHHFHFDDSKLELSQIIVATTPALEGHQVVRYLGVASEHKMLEQHLVEDENSTDVPRYYSELAQKLKAHALRAHANAVVGLNYQLTPLPSDLGGSSAKYRLTCTGNLVWMNKL